MENGYCPFPSRTPEAGTGVLGKPWVTGNGLNPEVLVNPHLSKWRLPCTYKDHASRGVPLCPSGWMKLPPKALAHKGADPELQVARPHARTGHPVRDAVFSLSATRPPPPTARRARLSEGSPLSEGKPSHAPHRLKNGILAPKKRILPHPTQESYKVQTWLFSFRTFQKPTNLTW